MRHGRFHLYCCEEGKEEQRRWKTDQGWSQEERTKSTREQNEKGAKRGAPKLRQMSQGEHFSLEIFLRGTKPTEKY